MATDRMRRVNEAVREVLSSRIAAGMRDPRIGFVTVTGVETSPDLRNATVYVSVLGEVDQQTQTMAGLEDSRKELQTAIAAELRMKNTPRIKFELDHSVERAIHVSELIREEADKRGDQEDE